MSIQPRLLVPLRGALALCLPLLFAACSPKAGTPDYKPPPNGPFLVSDYFAASGATGDGETAGLVTIHPPNSDCKARPAGADGSCYRFDYVPGQKLFAGVYWLAPANNWGAEPPQEVPGGPALTQVTFKAAVAAIPADQPAESMKFVIGGVGVGDPDPAHPRTADMHNDTFMNSDFFMVTTDWPAQSFTLKIPPGSNFTELVGAFAWFANYPPLPDTVDPKTFDYSTLTPKTIYIDDIHYE